MYLAELHGKLSKENENREDILTSNVFSFFKYADRKIFLLPFLQILAPDISLIDALDAEFFFWPQYDDGTEPDLVILAGRYYFLIEAKYHSGFGKAKGEVPDQLAREVQNGRIEAHNIGKVFKLVAVTSHYAKDHGIFKDVPADVQDASIWINWQKITLLLEQILVMGPPLPSQARLFAEDLFALLARKNLRVYAGQQFLSPYPQISAIADTLFFDAQTADYRDDFIGFIDTLKNQPEVVQFIGEVFFKISPETSKIHLQKAQQKLDSAIRIKKSWRHYQGMDAAPEIFHLDNIFFKEGKHGKI